MSMTMTDLSLEKNIFFFYEEQECICGIRTKTLVGKFYSIFANILLNNYTKCKINKLAGEKAEANNQSKKRKITTYK
jgi:hypothetical protein